MILNRREKIIFFVTIAVALAAVVYVYLIEPALKTGGSSADLKKYESLMSRKSEINNEYNSLFDPEFVGKNLGEQQIRTVAKIEHIIKEAGITEIYAIRPLDTGKLQDNAEIPVQIELAGTLNSLASFISKICAAELPYKIQKLSITGDELNPAKLKCNMVISFLWIKKI